MEKLPEEKENQLNQFSKSKSLSRYGNSTLLWDCGSTLYDSFELNSFKRQLDSAIANSHRTLSMSHLPERRVLPVQPVPERQQPSHKISRSFQKFLRSIFKSSNKSNVSSTITTTTTTTSASGFQVPEKYSKDRFYLLYDKSGLVLSTIPEVPEFEIASLSPEISSLVKRSASERFTTTAIDIACA